MTLLLQQIINALVTGAYYILIAVGLTIIYGILGIAHFAHGSVVMLGGYICFYAVTLLGLGFLPAVLGSMIITAAAGVLIERLAYRPASKGPRINGFIIALGLMMLLDSLGTNLFQPDQKIIRHSYTSTLEIGGVRIALMRIILIAAAVALIALLGLFINKTKLGKAIRATAQNQTASAIVGINPNFIISAVFAIGSATAAAAGSFCGALFSIYPAMSANVVSKAFAILILGGLGSFPGAIAGGLIVAAAEVAGASFLSSDYRDVFAFVIMIAVLMIRPQGLFGGARE